MAARSRCSWLLTLVCFLPLTAGFGQTGSLDSARAQFEQAKALSSQQGTDNFQRAIALFKQAAEAFHREPDSVSEAKTLDEIGTVFYHLGELDSSLAYLRRAQTIFLDVVDPAGEASTLSNIGTVLGDLGRPDSALAYYRAAMRHLLEARDRAGEAMTLSNIGGVFYDLGVPDSALFYLRAALRLSRELKDRPSEANALNRMGGVFLQVGRFDSALAHLGLAVAIYGEIGDKGSQASSLHNIAVVLGNLGRPDSALVYSREALPIVQEIGNRAGEAAILLNIGSIFASTGRSDSALFYYYRARQILREVGSRSGEASSLNNIGRVYEAVGRFDSALAYLAMALPIMREVRNRAGEGIVLNSIGNVLVTTLRPDSALIYYLASLAIRREVGDRPGEARTLQNVGAVFSVLGKPDSALAYCRAALPIFREVGDRAGEGVTLDNIGHNFAQLGNADSALIYFNAALPIRREVGDRVGEARTLTLLGRSYFWPSALRNPARATNYLDSAAAVSAGIRRSSGGQANRIAYAETQALIMELWAGAWLAREAEVGAAPSRSSALAAAERGRARALLDLLQRSADSAVGTAGIGTFLTRPGADLAAEADRFLDPLRRSKTGALSYLVTEDTLIVWLLTPGGELRVTQNQVSSDTLAALVQSLRTALGVDSTRGARARRNLDPIAIRLSGLLLPEDLLAQVPAGTEVVIVPHGILGLVPFALLPAGDGAGPLGIRNPLRFAPSLTALAAIEEGGMASDRAGMADRALVVGNPSMPTVAGSGGARIQLQPLPAARQEGERVAARLRSPVLTGAEASESVIRQRLPGATVVHLATHGLAYGSEATVRNSYVALAPDSLHDGLLTLGELVDDPALTLSADLVVLSACETGLGDLKRAEGTVGLQRGLLARGARNVLVSLWRVDDRSTALLMERFYAHWLDDPDRPGKAEALRRAQDDVRKQAEFSHPRHWAAFQLVGGS
jgi:CHAT domain-containing protein